MDENKRGFWSWIAGAPRGEAPIEAREGSVGSAGGDSLLPGAIPPARSAVTPMSVEVALSMSSVFRAANILCAAIQQLELRVERAGTLMKGTPPLVTKPDYDSNLSEFLNLTTMSMALHGNAYWLVTRLDEFSPVTRLQVLNPTLMIITYNKNGEKVYNYATGDGTVELPSWRIKHLKYMRTWGSDYGLGPIQAARVELQGIEAMRTYSSELFGSGGVIRGILTSDLPIDKETAEEYAKRLQDMAANRGMAVLGKGLSYTPIVMTPEDAQFISNQNFNVTAIARLFGIPANYMLADAGNSLTYQNMIQVDTMFARYTLSLYLREIEEAFTDLLPRGQKARFNMEGFLRADDKTRSEVNKTYKEMGVLSAQEIRDNEGWGPLPEELKAVEPAPTEEPEGEDNNE